MNTKGKSNVGHSAFQRLLNLSKENNENFNLLLIRYGIERFLYRLSLSKQSDCFILKGASLFLVWMGQNYRVTKDVDLLGFGKPDLDELAETFKTVCLIECPQDDGMVYLPDTVKAEAIREEQEYDGIRVTLLGMLNKARIPIQIDVGFGDSITPAPETIDFPALLEFPSPRLKAYPKYTLIAEKFEAMVRLGLANSRMKDFYDIWLLSKLFEFEANFLGQAILNTFKRRNTALPEDRPSALTNEFFEDKQKQIQWKAFVRKAKPTELEEDLKPVVGCIVDFLMPVLDSINQQERLTGLWIHGKGWKSGDIPIIDHISQH